MPKNRRRNAKFGWCWRHRRREATIPSIGNTRQVYWNQVTTRKRRAADRYVDWIRIYFRSSSDHLIDDDLARASETAPAPMDFKNLPAAEKGQV